MGEKCEGQAIALEKIKNNSEIKQLLKKLLLCALPLVAASILQQLFNTADMAVVGRFVGNEAYAAVGSTGTVISLFIEIFVGFSVGVNVVIAFELGKANNKKIKDGVHTAIVFSILCGVVIAVAGIISARSVLRLTLVPEEILDMATLYLQIYFAGMPFYMLYNFTSAIFRASGETRVPLVCITIGGALNVIFNLFFVLVFKMGVEGVAIATVISNVVSAVLLLVALSKRDDALRFRIRDLKFKGDILLRILKIGLPAGVLGSMFSISNLLVQSSVNSLGVDVISASSAASSLEIYVQYFGNAFAQTTTAYVSQNYGKGDLRTCKKVVNCMLVIGIFVCTVLSFAVYAGAGVLLKMFTTKEYVVALAKQRMIFTLLFKGVQSSMDVFVGALQGFARTLVPALVSVFCICGVRLVWIYTVFVQYHTLQSLMMIYPITWALAAMAHGTLYRLVLKRVKREKIKQE